MKKNELIEFLQRQVEYLQGKLDEALASVNSLTLSNKELQSTNEKLVSTVDELRKQIASLEDAIKGKGAELGKEKSARQAMRRLQEDHLQGPQVCAGREDIQRLRSCHALAELAIYRFLHRRTRRIALPPLHAA